MSRQSSNDPVDLLTGSPPRDTISELPKPRSEPPASAPSASQNSNASTASNYFTYPVKYAVSSAWRRISTDRLTPKSSSEKLKRAHSPRLMPPPFQPPPLAGLTLTGYKSSTKATAQLLSRLLAEEIRLLVPSRLQLVDSWRLIFSLDQDGASLSTLYDKCEGYRGTRGGYVLVVKDGSGGVFGAYLNEPPHPSQGHYYGNGECFLWRASILPSLPTLASLPPPPSADTTHAQRMTTVGSPKMDKKMRLPSPNGQGSRPNTGTSTPERIRFKAFPYSGMNEYMIFCEQGFLSVGGGDGRYGLWIDSSLERGVSQTCPTFGNENLSEDGPKFEVIGVEVWFLEA